MHTLKESKIFKVIRVLTFTLTLLSLAGCESTDDGDDNISDSNDESMVKWEVTGSVSPDRQLQGFAIDWSWTNDNGNQDLRIENQQDMLPWTKEESIPAGSDVTLAIVARPDAINRKHTFVLDMKVKLYVGGTVVDQITIDETIDPGYDNGVTVSRELSATVGE